jgi:hypothetical protein
MAVDEETNEIITGTEVPGAQVPPPCLLLLLHPDIARYVASKTEYLAHTPFFVSTLPQDTMTFVNVIRRVQQKALDNQTAKSKL